MGERREVWPELGREHRGEGREAIFPPFLGVCLLLCSWLAGRESTVSHGGWAALCKDHWSSVWAGRNTGQVIGLPGALGQCEGCQQGSRNV